MSCFVKAWPSSKVGKKMLLKVRERLGKFVVDGKKAVKKAYSADALSVRAVVKA